MADEYTQADAETAGWRIVHQADPAAETLNAEIWRAEKYVSPAGRPGRFLDIQATTEEKLYAAIEQREQQFSETSEGTVFVPAEGVSLDDTDTSDEGTFERITDAEHASARDNDVLTVLSDPEDPNSEPEQVVIRAGNEVAPEELSEPTAPSTQAEAETQEANDAAIASAIESRDNAENPSEADSPEAAAAAAQARNDAQAGDPGDSGNDPETTQAQDGQATDASDSEQQSQVPDSEAASSDQLSTNQDDGTLMAGQTGPEEQGPDTDAQAQASAPNADYDRATGEGLPESPAAA